MTAPDGHTWVDAEGALRDWFRADTDITALVSTRVFFRVPRVTVFPVIVITRIGGAPNGGSDVPMDNPILQIDIFGELPEAGGSKAQVTAVLQAVQKSLSKIRGGVDIVSGVRAFDARIVNIVFSPLSDEDRPRYFVTAVVPMLAVA